MLWGCLLLAPDRCNMLHVLANVEVGVLLLLVLEALRDVELLCLIIDHFKLIKVICRYLAFLDEF